MDFFQPGLREIGRKGQRLYTRARLQLARRRQGVAMTQLGLLGWQQADFDEATQRQVDEIQNVERAQSQHINAAAETAREIRRLQAERDAAQRAHAEARKQLEADARKAQEVRAQVERQVTDKRKVEPKFERHIPELDRELRDVNKLYAELIIQEKITPKMKLELVRLRERSVAIPNEKSDLRTQHLRAVTELRTLEESLARESEAATAAQQRVQYADGQWQAKAAEFGAQIKAQEKERAHAERKLRNLDAAKTNPYLRIGEVLANSGIAPINQPETLDEVRKVEVEVALLEEKIRESFAQNKAEDQQALRKSLWLCWAVALAVLLFLWWIW